MIRRFSFFMDCVISDVTVISFLTESCSQKTLRVSTVVSPLVIALGTDHHLVTKLKAIKIAVMGLWPSVPSRIERDMGYLLKVTWPTFGKVFSLKYLFHDFNYV